MAMQDYGYDVIRQNLQTSITHISIVDNASTEIVRIPVGDSRVTATNDNTGNTLTYTVVLTGSDADMGVGKTVGAYGLYDVATGGSAIDSDTFASAATFNSTADQITLTITVNAPAV